MELDFKNIYLGIVGIVGGLFWFLSYINVWRRPQIFIPIKYVVKKHELIRLFLLLLGVISWISISISLTGPRKPLGYVKNTIEVNDIFFVVDVSSSMTAVDFRPNRLEAAKKKMIEFVNLRPTDRIGIVIFAEKVFTLLPLSVDLNLIKQMIDEIRIGFLGGGTNIGDALGLAVARCTQSIAKNKTIVLLTDGVSNVGSLTPILAAEQARKQNVKVYAIAMGGRRDAKMPNGRRGYQIIPGGSYDMKTLGKIAKITGGKAYLAHDEAALKNVLANINKLEKTKIESSGRIVYQELYFLFLLWGVISLVFVELSRKIIVREVV